MQIFTKHSFPANSISQCPLTFLGFFSNSDILFLLDVNYGNIHIYLYIWVTFYTIYTELEVNTILSKSTELQYSLSIYKLIYKQIRLYDKLKAYWVQKFDIVDFILCFYIIVSGHTYCRFFKKLSFHDVRQSEQTFNLLVLLHLNI